MSRHPVDVALRDVDGTTNNLVDQWKPEPCEKHPPVYLGCPHCRIERQDVVIDRLFALVDRLLEDKEQLTDELHAANNRTMQAVKDGEGVGL